MTEKLHWATPVWLSRCWQLCAGTESQDRRQGEQAGAGDMGEGVSMLQLQGQGRHLHLLGNIMEEAMLQVLQLTNSFGVQLLAVPFSLILGVKYCKKPSVSCRAHPNACPWQTDSPGGARGSASKPFPQPIRGVVLPRGGFHARGGRPA